MNHHHPYNNIIEKKLEQLTVVDADHLWDDMHSILDKKMPQKKDRRRFIFWLLNSRGPLVLTFVLLITGSSILFLFTKERSIAKTNQVAASLQTDKSMENSVTKVSQERKINVTAHEPSQPNSIKIFRTSPSISASNEPINYNINKPSTIKQYKNVTEQDQFYESQQVISKTRSNFYVNPVRIEFNQQNFSIDTSNNEGIDFLIKKTKLSVNNVKSNSKKNNESGFYAGVMFGVDLSSIHFQSVRSGSTKGFLIGYAFNNKWSIESGLFADTKKVYDNGSYFNPPGYTPTNGITIVAVNGRSRLYEWPVNMKYNVISGKHNLFATTGLSSYFMKSENYDYEYTQNNQPGGHNYLSYTNETKNWFSVLNFSLGYTHKLGTTGNFRVEPYLKIPIKNLGVGNMPITSTGLNIGFTKQIK